MGGLCGAFFVSETTPLPERALQRMATSISHRSSAAARRLELPGGVLHVVGAQLAAVGDVMVAVDGPVLGGLVTADTGPDRDAMSVALLMRDRGLSLPADLRGEFVIAAWDADRRRGALVRDPFGVRPLYVAQVDGAVLFASELKSIVASGLVPADLDYAAIEIFFDLGYMAAPFTPLLGVRKVRAGHMVTVEGDALGPQSPVWDFPEPAVVRESAAEIEDRVLGALDDAMARHASLTERPGVMLSAGLDSALVLSLLRRHTSAPVTGLTVGFSDMPSANELRASARVAAALGARHHAVSLSLEWDAISLSDLVWLVDEPIADLSAVGYGALAHAAVDEVDVAFSGLMADALFAADVASRRLEVLSPLLRLPLALRRAVRAPLRAGPERLGRLAEILAARSPAERYRVQWAPPDAQRSSLLRGPLAELDGGATRSLLAELAGDVSGHPLCLYSYLDQQLCADSVCQLADRAATAGPIDIRFPFADRRVVESAATLPASLRSRRLETKIVLRRLGERLLPAGLLEGPKVGFFDTVTPHWVRAQLRRGGADMLLDRAARTSEMVDRAAVERSVRDALADGPVGLLFPLLLLEGWLSLYLPRALAADGLRRPAVVATPRLHE
jgi:asparagine synthase (glutamine-hydrolysing)